MPEQCQELVLGAIRVFDPLKMKRQNLLVLAPEALAYPQQYLEFEVGTRVYEVPKFLAFDLQDNTGLTSPDSGGARHPFEETHLPERFSFQHERQQDRLAAFRREHGFG